MRGTRSRVFFAGSLILIGLAGAPPADAQPVYTVVSLGTLEDGPSVALGLNALGQVVGYSEVQSPGGGVDHAFVWLPAAAQGA